MYICGWGDYTSWAELHLSPAAKDAADCKEHLCNWLVLCSFGDVDSTAASQQKVLGLDLTQPTDASRAKQLMPGGFNFRAEVSPKVSLARWLVS